MATYLPSCFSIEFLEQLLKFLANFTLLKYVKSQRSYGFLITKELTFGFQILDLKDHFSASLSSYLAHKFFETKHITGAPGCYGSTVIMTTEDFPITRQYGSILGSYFAHIFLGSKAITSIPGFY